MKNTYIKPETEINAPTLQAAILVLSGQNENNENIIGDGGNGDDMEGDANRYSLWEEEESY
jgi:hypothetical protein